MIIANLHYIVSIDQIDAHVVEHRKLLQDLCDNGIIVCSGPKDPRTGGIMMLNVGTIAEAQQILSADPFMRENLATYEFIAFNPLKCAEAFKVFFEMSNHWLMKSEPDVFSWDMLVTKKTAPWDDVRNYQARNNMMAMKKGDQIFFYHSNIGREVVGIMKVVREHYPDPKDPRFVLVDVAPVKKFKTPVTLATIKAHKELQNIALIKQSRLSVMPITDKEWEIISDLGT